MVKINRNISRLKTTELSGSGIPKDTMDASLIYSPSDNQSRREQLPFDSQKESKEIEEVTPQLALFVPVVSKTGQALMPCHPARARELIRKGKAIRRFKTGIYYLQLTQRISGEIQEVAVGIDSGSKREAFTVKSEYHTYLNILSDAVTWVKRATKTRKECRRSRRFRKTPCRKNRCNKKTTNLPASTKARWQIKLRILNILKKIYPISCYVVEDIKAKPYKGYNRWNKIFSPLELGKNWFYSELTKLGKVELKKGYETKELREVYSLQKTNDKLEESFFTHNVDSWVLANWYVGGHVKPDNEQLFRLIPLRFHRRQLHYLQPTRKYLRKNLGSTLSDGLKRGSLIKHKKYGICYLGGYSHKSGFGLLNLRSGDRLCQNAKKTDLEVLGYNYFRWYSVNIKKVAC